MPCPECGGKVRSHELGQECRECDWDSVTVPSGDYSKTADMNFI